MAQLSTLTSDLVGRRYPEFKFVVTSLWLRDYKQALAFEESEIKDDSYVPSTFVSCFRDGEFSAFAALDIELSQLLHTAHHYTFHSKIQVGDVIVGQTEIARLLKKKGKMGELVFMDFKNEFRRQARKDESDSKALIPVALSIMTLVVRSPS